MLMWCPHCQSDVPQAASATSGARRCCRCGKFATTSQQSEKPAGWRWRAGSDEGLDLGTEPGVSTTATRWDDWTLAAEVRRARSMLARARDRESLGSYRYDANQLLALRAQSDPDPSEGVQVYHRPRKRHRGWRVVSLVVIGAGALAFCYGIAVAASLVNGAAAVTQLGVPLMLAGLFGLILDLLLQVVAMRRESRSAVDRMRLVELRLQEYRQAALLLGSAHHAPSHAVPAPMLTRGRLDDSGLRPFKYFAAEHF